MDFRGRKDLPRGIRNNNPGNLVKTSIQWQGKVPGSDPRFETFENIYYGIRAAYLDIYSDVFKKKLNTIQKLISSYAPKSENPTEAYIQTVVKATGINRNQIISSPQDLDKILASILKVENGPKAAVITSEMIKKGINMANVKSIPKTVAIGSSIILLIGGVIILLNYGKR